ncbi:hypothetical protein WJX84_007522, partial [Apatococcus fuscideae]
RISPQASRCIWGPATECEQPCRPTQQITDEAQPRGDGPPAAPPGCTARAACLAHRPALSELQLYWQQPQAGAGASHEDNMPDDLVRQSSMSDAAVELSSPPRPHMQQPVPQHGARRGPFTCLEVGHQGQAPIDPPARDPQGALGPSMPNPLWDVRAAASHLFVSGAGAYASKKPM